MPLYEFAAEDGKTINLVMDTKQPAEAYRVQVVDGKTYKRVYDVPHMSVNSRGGTSAQDFVRKTTGKNLKVGEMQDISKEMHLERADKEGKDQVKEKFYEGYEKRMGVKHTDVVRRTKDQERKDRLAKAKKNLAKYGVQVDLNAKPQPPVG